MENPTSPPIDPEALKASLLQKSGEIEESLRTESEAEASEKAKQVETVKKGLSAMFGRDKIQSDQNNWNGYNSVDVANAYINSPEVSAASPSSASSLETSTQAPDSKIPIIDIAFDTSKETPNTKIKKEKQSIISRFKNFIVNIGLTINGKTAINSYNNAVENYETAIPSRHEWLKQAGERKTYWEQELQKGESLGVSEDLLSTYRQKIQTISANETKWRAELFEFNKSKKYFEQKRDLIVNRYVAKYEQKMQPFVEKVNILNQQLNAAKEEFKELEEEILSSKATLEKQEESLLAHAAKLQEEKVEASEAKTNKRLLSKIQKELDLIDEHLGNSDQALEEQRQYIQGLEKQVSKVNGNVKVWQEKITNIKDFARINSEEVPEAPKESMQPAA